jgi:hypothetical protein
MTISVTDWVLSSRARLWFVDDKRRPRALRAETLWHPGLRLHKIAKAERLLALLDAGISCRSEVNFAFRPFHQKAPDGPVGNDLRGLAPHSSSMSPSSITRKVRTSSPIRIDCSKISYLEASPRSNHASAGIFA